MSLDDGKDIHLIIAESTWFVNYSTRMGLEKSGFSAGKCEHFPGMRMEPSGNAYVREGCVMKRFVYRITDPLGIHARPAGLLAREAAGFPDTVITLEKGGASVQATQMLRVMSLGVKAGDEVQVTAEGPCEAVAISAMEAFFRGQL